MRQPARGYNQVEADLHRVLTLARAQQKRCRVPGERAKSAVASKLNATSEKNVQRHRHALGRRQQSDLKSLSETKMTAISAIYGLNCSMDKLSDCTRTRVKHHKSEMELDERCKADEVERVREQLLDSRRERYRQHYSTIKNAYGPSGKPKLEDLLQAAHQAKLKMAPHAAVAIGASVLTSSNRIYAAGASDNLQVCAERAVVLKMETSDPGEVIAALAISSDQLQTLPFPCGSCRELMATFGEFPVYLVNGDGMSEETTSFNLFPCATNCSSSSRKKPQEKSSSSCTISIAQSEKMHQSAKKCSTPVQPKELRDWTTEHVLEWLDNDVGLAQYHDVFERNNIDGCTLLHLQESDIQLLLGIMHPLHRKRILVCVDRLRDRELLEHGVDYGQLQDYLAVLDRDRIAVISELKSTFDRLDQNKDGFLDFQELKHALVSLHCSSSAQAVEELLREGGALGGGNDGRVCFADFTKAFSSLAMQPAVEDNRPHQLPLVDIAAMRKQFEQADSQKRGWLDELQLTLLVQTIAKPADGSVNVRKWFPSVDFDREPRVKFSDFVIWWARIKHIDIGALKRTFEGFEPLDSSLLKPFTVLPRSLATLFPDVRFEDIAIWCTQHLGQLDGSDTRELKVPKTISFPDFTLACLCFRRHVHERVMHTSEMKRAMRNDALCHQTRIVHLQQTGHVRLCPQTLSQSAIGEQRRHHIQSVIAANKHEKRDSADDESKDCDSDEGEDEYKRRKQKELEREINLTFDRFIGRTNRSDEECKLREEDDEDDEGNASKLTAIQAAQAMTELGVTWPRKQIVQVIQSEGFGMQKCVDRRAFRRLLERLKSITRARTIVNNPSNPDALHERKIEKMAALLHGEHGKHRNRFDYDEYLRQRRTGKQQISPKPSHKARRSWNREMNRYESGRHRRQIRTSQESKDDSSIGNSEYSSSRSKAHRHQHRSQSRSNNRRQRTRSQSSSHDSDTCDSSTETEDTPHLLERRTRWRNFEVGDRIETRRDGHGTIVRLYPDYFVADIHFDSGKKLKNVTLSELKRIQQHRPKKTEEFRMGMAVLIAHKGTKTTRHGKIVACRMDNTFDVLVRDLGHTETLKRIPITALRPLCKPVFYMQGAKVKLKQRDEYLRGSIQCCRTNGSYDIKLRKNQKLLTGVVHELLSPDDDDDDDDDDDEEDEEKTRMDRDSPRQERRQQDESDDEDKQSDEDSFEPEFEKGESVEVRYQGKDAFYPGKIAKVFTNGTYDILYDDGDEEFRVVGHLIRVKKANTKQQSAIKAKAKTKHDDYEEDLFESD